MGEPAFTVRDLKKVLRRIWKDTGCDLKGRHGLGVSTKAIIEHSAKRSKRLKDPHFDLWIAIYDEFVSWLVSLVTVAHWANRKEPYKPTDYECAVVLLLMRIVADSFAMRHLMLLGFDAAARTQVRSTTEHIEVLAAILDDPILGTAFCMGRDTAAANKFWKDYVSKHKIRPRIKEVWLKFFDGDHGAARWFANWGSREYPELSAIAHPSFMGCVHSAVPAKATYTDETWIGMWGDRSLTSIGTIQTYISYLFPVVLALGDFPFGRKSKHFTRPRRYNERNDLHNHIKHGRAVLTSLILSLNNPDAEPYIYPEVVDPKGPVA